MDSLPSLSEASPDECVDLFLRKLKLCENTYDFSDARLQVSQKEEKRRHLVDIAEYVSSQRVVFNEGTYEPFMAMVSANIMRALPIGTTADVHFDPDDDEPFLEPAWAHLQIVYELLRRFVVSSETDSKAARSCITMEFVHGIVELFNSEDPREREYLKTILHRIYGKVMPLRGAIRRAIMNVFHRVVYEDERHNGIAELLEILGSIINGFAVPLKEEHKQLLRKALMPLHVPASMPSYHVQLSFCVTQFVEKESELAAEIVQGLIRHWPATHSRKEVMLLNEMEELLELAKPEELRPVVGALFRRIGKCIESAHFQVAERALFYWNNEYIVTIIAMYREIAMGAVVGPLKRNMACHWNANVLSLSSNVQKLLSEMDGKMYEKCSQMYDEEKIGVERREVERVRRWRAVYKMAHRRMLDQAERTELKYDDGDGTVVSKGDGVENLKRIDRESESEQREGEVGSIGGKVGLQDGRQEGGADGRQEGQMGKEMRREDGDRKISSVGGNKELRGVARRCSQGSERSRSGVIEVDVEVKQKRSKSADAMWRGTDRKRDDSRKRKLEVGTVEVEALRDCFAADV